MIMASETYDYESFDNTDHTMKQIADAIRHKGYGKDVREAIAQGMESYDRTSGELFKRMNKVEEKTDQEIEARKKGDDAEKAARQSADDSLEKRIKKLEDNSATHDEVEAAKSYMDHKAERVAWGSDGSTFTTMLTRALEDVQMQELIKNIIKG